MMMWMREERERGDGNRSLVGRGYTKAMEGQKIERMGWKKQKERAKRREKEEKTVCDQNEQREKRSGEVKGNSTT